LYFYIQIDATRLKTFDGKEYQERVFNFQARPLYNIRDTFYTGFIGVSDEIRLEKIEKMGTVMGHSTMRASKMPSIQGG